MTRTGKAVWFVLYLAVYSLFYLFTIDEHIDSIYISYSRWGGLVLLGVLILVFSPKRRIRSFANMPTSGKYAVLFIVWSAATGLLGENPILSLTKTGAIIVLWWIFYLVSGSRVYWEQHRNLSILAS